MSSEHSRRRGFAPFAFLAIGAILVASGCSATDPVQDPAIAADDTGVEEVFTPLVAAPLADPSVVGTTDGLRHIAYELFATNTIGQAIAIDALSVVDGEDELLRLSGDELLS